ncbi:nucleoside deaminase [Aureivirga marina]|uniref:nucleoside deaminase n=1 Tax=Aureivirga marina TaxID=1182451 RepID=UPI0018CA0EE1|nr:nucleoside deaminase [Aureivirga marina]
MNTKLKLLILSFLILINSSILAQEIKEENQISPEQEELDQFFMLMSMAMTYKFWQKEAINKRGANIGAILVDENGKIVSHGLDSEFVLGNRTKHAEMVTIESYFIRTQKNNLEKLTLYSTIESCAMCAGALTFKKLERDVYGQKDSIFGNAFQRLQYNSSEDENGFQPYPDKVELMHSEISEIKELEKLHEEFDWENKALRDFLVSKPVEAVFEKAYEKFFIFNPIYPENKEIIENARKYFQQL